MDIETYALLKKKIENGEIEVDPSLAKLSEEDLKLIQEKAPGIVNYGTASLSSLLDYHMAQVNTDEP